MGFWENVRAEIIKQNTTQEWIARKVGMDHGAFRAALSKKQEPRVSKALAIADALGVTVEYLFLGRESSMTYEDMRIIQLAKRHLEILEALDSMSEQTRDIIKAQIMAVAVKKTDGYMVAEREPGNGSS